MATGRRIVYCPRSREDFSILQVTVHSPQTGTTLDELLAERRLRILDGLDIASLKGVEIGALNQPIVPKADANVIYVDHAVTDELRAKYAADPNVDATKIVEVDAVWGERSLAEALGCGADFDYVVASHVVEHVPDLITWLSEIEAILKPGGSLRLAVPDRRFTFDRFRPESRLPELLDAWLRRARRPTSFQLLDHFIHIIELDLIKAWQGRIGPEDFRPLVDVASALNIAASARTSDAYYDAHCWVFTPRSFAGLMAELARGGHLNYACDRFFDTQFMGLEFVVSMARSTDREAMIASWRQMEAAAMDLPVLPPPQAPPVQSFLRRILPRLPNKR